jgi:ribose/xylose/arabinose/galactoside ABC-type transport system permease subunit
VSQASASTPANTLWTKLLRAQEAGLVLVIALLMLCLSIFSKPIDQRDFVKADAGSVTETAGVYSAQVEGKPRTFATSEGWELRGGGENQSFQRTRKVNKFFNLQNLVQLLVNASFIAIMAVAITAVIAMGGIDLSIGSIYALAALIVALVLRYHWPSGNAWPAPTLLGSGALWAAGVVGGFIALVASIVMGMKKPANVDVALAKKRSAFTTSLAAASLGVLIIVGWQLVRSMRDGWQSDQQASLSWAVSLPLALVVSIVVGGLCGLLNGTMIVGLRVHPFIITLGTMAAYRGLCSLPTKSQSVANMSPSFQEFLTWSVGGVTPVPVIIMLVVALLGTIILSMTVIGRQVYAIGGNEVAAKYAGIPVGRVKVIVYTLMGMMAGLAGFVYVGYYGAAAPNAGTGYELSVIAAAVIGGASLSGGRGSPIGAVLGAILVQLIDNSLVILDIDQSYKNIVIGGAIIAAVVLDQAKARLLPGR